MNKRTTTLIVDALYKMGVHNSATVAIGVTNALMQADLQERIDALVSRSEVERGRIHDTIDERANMLASQ